MMPGFVGRLLDGNDRSAEASVVLAGAAFLADCLFQGVALFRGQQFDAASFGVSIASILAGTAGAAVGQGYLSGRTFAAYGGPRGRAGATQTAASDDGGDAAPDDPDA